MRSITRCDPGLFFDRVAGAHMAPYYSWWALDCFGYHMIHGGSKQLRSVYDSTVAGLLSLAQPPAGGEVGFPIALDSLADAGATAQIADVLARLDWQEHSNLVTQCLHFVTRILSLSQKDPIPFPFTIWAFFSLLKTCNERGAVNL